MSGGLLLDAVTTTTTGTSKSMIPNGGQGYSFQALVAGVGAVAATVIIEVTNISPNWITLGTITLSGTTSASDGFVSLAPWGAVRARVTSPTGAVTCWMVG